MPRRTDIFHYESWTPFIEAKEFTRNGQRFDALSDCKVYLNSRYQVAVREDENEQFGPLVHLSIKSLQNDHRRDWRDFQRIKNELVGPEYEAIEIYPADSRLVDNSNQWHIWVFKTSGLIIPIGFQERLVSENASGSSSQRPFDDDNRPDGLVEITEEIARF